MRAKGWESGKKYDIQSNYEVTLDMVQCTSGEWDSCSFYMYPDWRCKDHSRDVFISCYGEFLLKIFVEKTFSAPILHQEHLLV